MGSSFPGDCHWFPSPCLWNLFLDRSKAWQVEKRLFKSGRVWNKAWKKLLTFHWENAAWRDSSRQGKLWQKCAVKDQPGNYSPNGGDDVGFQEIKANLWLTLCAGEILSAGTAPDLMEAGTASVGCLRYRWKFLCGNVRGSVLSSDSFVLADFSPPYSKRVPEFNQTRTWKVGTAENFHVTMLARKWKKGFLMIVAFGLSWVNCSVLVLCQKCLVCSNLS